MTLTAFFCTGWEHGVATLVTTGGGLMSASGGTPTSDAAAARSGSYGLLINPSAASEYYRIVITETGIRKSCARFYVRYTTMPTADMLLFAFQSPAGTTLAEMRFQNSTTRWTLKVGASAEVAFGPNPIANNTWYRVDIQYDSSTTTGTIRAKIDGGTEGSQTNTITAIDQLGWQIGNSSNNTYVVNIDDFIVGTFTVASEYWGDGQVIGLVPSGDGTHNAGTNVMENQAGADIGSGGGANAYELTDEIPMSDTTTYIQQSAIGTGNYAEANFGDLPTNAGTINAARAILMYGASAATNTNTGGTTIRRNDNSTDVINVGSAVTTANINQPSNAGTTFDMSDTPPLYKGAMVPATANGTDYSSLTPGIVNNLRVRMGFSSDVTPVPRWYNVMLEVDYVATAPKSLVAAQPIRRQPLLRR